MIINDCTLSLECTRCSEHWMDDNGYCLQGAKRALSCWLCLPVFLHSGFTLTFPLTLSSHGEESAGMAFTPHPPYWMPSLQSGLMVLPFSSSWDSLWVHPMDHFLSSLSDEHHTCPIFPNAVNLKGRQFLSAVLFSSHYILYLLKFYAAF